MSQKSAIPSASTEDALTSSNTSSDSAAAADSYSGSLPLYARQQAAVSATYRYWQKVQTAARNLTSPTHPATAPDHSAIALNRHTAPLNHSAISPNFLWNAKPRFGKTIAAYAFAQKINAQRILIITNRPALADAWASDFFQYLAPQSDYIFASSSKPHQASTPQSHQSPVMQPHQSSNSRSRQPSAPQSHHIQVYTRAELTQHPDLLRRPLIYFISLQDIKGHSLDSTDFKTKNQWIFDAQKPWDLLILDESHEGIKTAKTARVLAKIKTHFTLHLSGTPFRAVKNRDFAPEQIFNYSYLDEQQENELSPRLDFRLSSLADFLPAAASAKASAKSSTKVPAEAATAASTKAPSKSSSNLSSAPFCSLAEFFRTSNGEFVHAAAVRLWLDRLASNFQRLSARTLPDNFRHTFWRLSGINECRAMQKMLATHPFFKNYQTIVAAGSQTGGSPKTLLQVREAIAQFSSPANSPSIASPHSASSDTPLGATQPTSGRISHAAAQPSTGRTPHAAAQPSIGHTPQGTITLSCGQLTTGITIPEWGAVLMLYSSADLSRVSAANYLQTAFRAQNPSANFPKSSCYIFDFDPERALTILNDYAQNLCGNANSLSDLWQYLDAYHYHPKWRWRPISAREAASLAQQVIANEIVDGNFVTSDKLFNLNAIFQMSSRARKIINRLSARQRNRFEPEPTELAFPSTKLDADGQIIVGADLLAAAHQKLLQNPRYAKLPAREQRPLQKLAASKLARRRHQQELADFRAKLRGFTCTIPLLLHLYGLSAAKANSSAQQKQPTAPSGISPFSSAATSDDSERQSSTFGNSAQNSFELTLAKLVQRIPNTDFELCTGITKSDFQLLVQENYFNLDSFDLAIQEFLRRAKQSCYYYRDALAGSFNVFDHLSAQPNGYIFTPPAVVQTMLARLEQSNPQLFQNATTTFFDPSSHSGLFLAAIIARLYQNQRANFASDHDCLYHILSQQIFACSPSQLAHQATIATLFNFLYLEPQFFTPKERRQIAEHFVIVNSLALKGGSTYAKLSTTILQQIDDWTGLMKESQPSNANAQSANEPQPPIVSGAQPAQNSQSASQPPLHFDVIIGNPPYQLGRRQLYADFYRLAVELDPQLICMIFPRGWQKTYNNNGLGQLNNATFKRDPHLVSIDNYAEQGEDKIFPSLNTGGVNIVLRNRAYDNNGHIQQLIAGEPAGELVLPIKEQEVVKPRELTCLIEPLTYTPKISALASARDPYGLPASSLRDFQKLRPNRADQPSHFQKLRPNRAAQSSHFQKLRPNRAAQPSHSHTLRFSATKNHPDDVRVLGLLADETRGYKFLPRAELPKTNPNLDAYKLFVPKAWGNMSERVGLGGSYANICVAAPGDACTETFLEFAPFASRHDAECMAKYFLTQFFRALLYLAKITQNTTRDKYRFIPVPDFVDPIWETKNLAELNAYLMKLYKVPSGSQDFIRRNLQPRDLSNIEFLD